MSGGVEGALQRYRILATVVGTALLILVFVGMTLQFGAHQRIVVEIMGPFHGFLYIVYLVAVLDLTVRARCSLLQLAAMIGAGFIPFLAFFIERRVTASVRGKLAGSLGAVGSETRRPPG